MNCSGKKNSRKTVLISTVAAGLLSIGLPLSNAFGVGTWAYPETGAERTERIKLLDGELSKRNGIYETNYQEYITFSETLAMLESNIRVAEETLVNLSRPATEAMMKYRQAQEISLADPQISPEPQRLDLIQAQKDIAEAVQKQQTIIDELKAQRHPAQEKVTSRRNKLNTILRQIDDLVKHREAVSEVMFVRSVAD